MQDTDKMLRAIINGQSAMKEELLREVKKLQKDVDDFRHETKENFDKVNKRIDNIGSHLAYLEDDAPTAEEFKKLEKRVTKLELSIK